MKTEGGEEEMSIVGDKEDDGDGMTIGELEVEEMFRRSEVWIQEVRVTWESNEAEEEIMLEEAWDDVKGGGAPQDRGFEEGPKGRGKVYDQ